MAFDKAQRESNSLLRRRSWKTVLIALGLVGVYIILVYGLLFFPGIFFIFIKKGPIPCSQLTATREQLEQLLIDHNDMVNRLLPLTYDLWIESDRCPGKAELMIGPHDRKDEKEIRSIIGDTFFGYAYTVPQD